MRVGQPDFGDDNKMSRTTKGIASAILIHVTAIYAVACQEESRESHLSGEHHQAFVEAVTCDGDFSAEVTHPYAIDAAWMRHRNSECEWEEDLEAFGKWAGPRY